VVESVGFQLQQASISTQDASDRILGIVFDDDADRSIIWFLVGEADSSDVCIAWK
jgi:hypothetical protein